MRLHLSGIPLIKLDKSFLTISITFFHILKKFSLYSPHLSTSFFLLHYERLLYAQNLYEDKYPKLSSKKSFLYKIYCTRSKRIFAICDRNKSPYCPSVASLGGFIPAFSRWIETSCYWLRSRRTGNSVTPA